MLVAAAPTVPAPLARVQLPTQRAVQQAFAAASKPLPARLGLIPRAHKVRRLSLPPFAA